MYKWIKNMSWYKYVALFGKKRSKETRGKADRRREASARGQHLAHALAGPGIGLSLQEVYSEAKQWLWVMHGLAV